MGLNFLVSLMQLLETMDKVFILLKNSCSGGHSFSEITGHVSKAFLPCAKDEGEWVIGGEFVDVVFHFCLLLLGPVNELQSTFPVNSILRHISLQVLICCQNTLPHSFC